MKLRMSIGRFQISPKLVLCILVCSGYWLVSGCAPSPQAPRSSQSGQEIDVPDNPPTPPPTKQSSTPNPPPNFVGIAQQHVSNGNIQAALDELRKAADVPENRGLALSMAGELLIKVGDAATAVGVLRSAAAADPSNPAPRRILAGWFYDIGAMDDALSELEELAKIVPADARPLRMRGLILKDFERFTEAVQAYQESVKRGLPDSLRNEVHLELAECLLKLREPTKAKQALSGLEASVPSKLIEAECWLAEGDMEKGIQLLDQIQTVEPQNARAMKLRAEVLLEEGNSTKAIEILESAVQLDPFEYDLRAQLMSAYSRAGVNDKAQALKIEMEKLRERRLTFTKLHHRARTEPASASVRLELGRLAKELGKLEMARSWFKAASVLDPADPTALKELKELDENPGQP